MTLPLRTMSRPSMTIERQAEAAFVRHHDAVVDEGRVELRRLIGDPAATAALPAGIPANGLPKALLRVGLRTDGLAHGGCFSSHTAETRPGAAAAAARTPRTSDCVTSRSGPSREFAATSCNPL